MELERLYLELRDVQDDPGKDRRCLFLICHPSSLVAHFKTLGILKEGASVEGGGRRRRDRKIYFYDSAGSKISRWKGKRNTHGGKVKKLDGLS